MYRRHEATFRARGWLLLEAGFPTVFLALAAPQIKPTPLLFGVLLDFTNYDVEPPSLLLVDALTKRPLALRELVTRMPRRSKGEVQVQLAPVAQPGAEGPAVAPPPGGPPPAGGPPPLFVNLASPPVDLMQGYPEAGYPFMCLEGIYEYHQHPAHSGNDWLLHRDRGAGTLHAILTVFETYAVRPLLAYHVGARMSFSPQPNQPVQQLQLQVNGFFTSGPPE